MLRRLVFCLPLLASCAATDGGASRLGAPSSTTQEPGTIQGLVRGNGGQGLGGVDVVLLEHATGYPLARNTGRAIIDPEPGIDVFDWWTETTDLDGSFRFEGVPDGRYRLTAQSGSLYTKPDAPLRWSDAADILTIHGVANDVRLGPGTGARVDLEPLGDGVFHYDWSAPNDDVYLVLSRNASLADPVLGLVGWRGPFLQGALGIARMTSGSCEVRGLPRVPVHAAVFANDNTPGYWFERVPLDAAHRVRSTERPVAYFSSGRQSPPDRLVPLTEHLVAIDSRERDAAAHAAISGSLDDSFDATRAPRSLDMAGFSAYIDHVGPLDRPVEVEDCPGAWTVGDVLAARGYAAFAR